MKPRRKARVRQCRVIAQRASEICAQLRVDLRLHEELDRDDPDDLVRLMNISIRLSELGMMASDRLQYALEDR